MHPMKNKNNPVPDFKRIIYTFDTEKGAYVSNDIQALKPPLNALGDSLLKQPPLDNNVMPFPVYRLRNSDYKATQEGFYTNLYQAAHTGWYIGNHFRLIDKQRCINTILVKNLPKEKAIELYYFLSPDTLGVYDRIAFANEVIPHLKKLSVVK